jgi:hypothetical protein
VLIVELFSKVNIIISHCVKAIIKLANYNQFRIFDITIVIIPTAKFVNFPKPKDPNKRILAYHQLCNEFEYFSNYLQMFKMCMYYAVL